MNIDRQLVKDLSFQLRRDGLIYDFSRRELVVSADTGNLEAIVRVEEISKDKCYAIILTRLERFEKIVDDIDLRHFRHLLEETYDSNIEQLIMSTDKSELEKVKKIIEDEEERLKIDRANIIDFMRYKDGLR